MPHLLLGRAAHTLVQTPSVTVGSGSTKASRGSCFPDLSEFCLWFWTHGTYRQSAHSCPSLELLAAPRSGGPAVCLGLPPTHLPHGEAFGANNEDVTVQELVGLWRGQHFPNSGSGANDVVGQTHGSLKRTASSCAPKPRLSNIAFPCWNGKSRRGFSWLNTWLAVMSSDGADRTWPRH